MRISDWSSDVCSSDLDGTGDPSRPLGLGHEFEECRTAVQHDLGDQRFHKGKRCDAGLPRQPRLADDYQPTDDQIGYAEMPAGDRKSVVEGKGGSVRVDLGGRRIIKKKK